MNRILNRGAIALTCLLVLTACDNAATTNESANAAAVANQSAREAAREMHNEMTANGTDEHRTEGMQGMNEGDGMGRMKGGEMNKMNDAPMNNSMPMEDDSNHM